MKLSYKSLLLATIVAISFASCGKQTVCSPDKNIRLSFFLDENGAPYYSIEKNKAAVINPSQLGIIMAETDLSQQMKVVSTKKSKHDDTWQTTWGEETEIRNHYNELAVKLQNADNHHLLIRFRVFDDGFAFRYEFPDENGDFRIMDEATSYSFAKDPKAWSIPWDTPYYEGLWTKAPLSEKTDTLCSPLTLEFADGTYGFLHEAAVDDYAAQNFYLSPNPLSQGDGADCGIMTLRTFLTPWANKTKVYGSFGKTVSPWRFMILADDITELAASRIMLNLNEPCKIEDTSWIQPMKFIGIWWAIHLDHYSWCYRILDEKGRFKRLAPHHGATTENMIRYIDFAADHGFGGVLAEGWNEGWDGDWTSNLADFTTPTPDFDIRKISEYARQKGVQVIGHHETGGNITNYEQQLDSALRFYDELGIHNVKTGYVHAKLEGKEYHKSQYGVRHMNHVIRTAAENHVCIDNHECVMPSGLCRTYPNLMSGEGVRGQEWDAWSTDGGSPASHLCILPFTRCMTGPVDFTPGTFDFSNPIHPQTRVHSTLARQLALFVTIYSPLQMASDMPESYMKHPDALRFIEDVPCDWQKSIVTDAKIGEYVITARQDRHSDDWYVGAITNEEERDVSIPLTFLEKGRTYTVDIYRDAPATEWQNNPYEIVIEQKQLTADDTLEIHLAAAGGAAIRLTEIQP